MRRGVVRLHPQLLADLGLREGDPVRLTGRRSSAAVVAPTETSASPYLLYADDLTLGNLGKIRRLRPLRHRLHARRSRARLRARDRLSIRAAIGVVEL